MTREPQFIYLKKNKTKFYNIYIFFVLLHQNYYITTNIYIDECVYISLNGLPEETKDEDKQRNSKNT
jgi:hypothetical protein